jgi:methylmalonyl-CoA mutase cobalamin-binding subunit
LKREGVAAVFQPGASLEEIVQFIRSSVPEAAGTGRSKKRSK